MFLQHSHNPPTPAAAIRSIPRHKRLVAPPAGRRVPASVTTFGDIALEDALVLVAFPTTGAAAPIAAHYLTRHLDLPLVGQIRLPELDHLIAVRDGRATSVVRIFGGEVSCGLDHGCPRVYLATTEVSLPPELTAEYAAAIVAWAKNGRAHMMLALEGVVREEGDDTPDVYVAATNPDVTALLQSERIRPAGQALVGGMAAQVALAAMDQGIPAAVLMVEATRDHPDGRAAAALIEALDEILPDIKVDAKPLLEEALELEEEIKKAMTPPPMSGQRAPHTFI